MKRLITALILVVMGATSAMAVTEADFIRLVRRGCDIVSSKYVPEYYNFEKPFKNGDERTIFRDGTCAGYNTRMAGEYGSVSISTAAASGHGVNTSFNHANYCFNMVEFEKNMGRQELLELTFLYHDAIRIFNSPTEDKRTAQHAAFIYNMGAGGGAYVDWNTMGERAFKLVKQKQVTNAPLQRFVTDIMAGDYAGASSELKAASHAVADMETFCKNLAGRDVVDPATFIYDSKSGRH
jgi:hypothetical protein